MKDRIDFRNEVKKLGVYTDIDKLERDLWKLGMNVEEVSMSFKDEYIEGWFYEEETDEYLDVVITLNKNYENGEIVINVCDVC